MNVCVYDNLLNCTYLGCKVIAFAGSDEKVSWLKELGIDHVFNYKSTDVSKTLAEVAPNGINCYFDNVSKM